jgi:Raf kinase inhibitor-like YbhB/YbcL family protein
MRLRSDDFQDGRAMPDALAFARPASGDEPIQPGSNQNPHLAWSEVPAGTRSFVLVCVDEDVPSVGDDVNKAGRRIAASLPRVEFVHWLMVDIPRECGELARGSCSDGVVAHGKAEPPGPPGSRQGINDYTRWFAGDTAMAGDYRGYDGPCPPWNDERLHRYHFTLHALGIAALALPARFTLGDVRAAMAPHELGRATLSGTYSLDPAVRRPSTANEPDSR